MNFFSIGDFENIGKLKRTMFKVAEFICCLVFAGLMILSIILLTKFFVWALF